ncbi:MAG: DNA replication/repair protein RecF [Lachnospiraceae bacterium]|jgi:DNA replication and repair protein RecF
MFIESLSLADFRNFSRQELKFSRGINIFTGDNAQGKTNLLEAMSLCSTGRSFRGAKDRDLIRFGCTEGHIKLTGEKKDIPYRIDIHLRKYGNKGIAVNSVPIRKISELYGLLHIVFFCPDDLQLVKSGPSERRKYLDMEMGSLDRGYLKDLIAYHRCLDQRNALLKTIGFDGRIPDTLDVWDKQLAEAGTRIIRARRRFVKDLSPVIQEIHAKISGGKEELYTDYDPDVSEENFSSRLRENRERDLKFRTTGVGPHRDDLVFSVVSVSGGNSSSRTDLREFGSQGQQRTAALSAKMAEIEMIRKFAGESPVLLLDDVLSELDERRQKSLLNEIRDTQTMITCTGLDDLIRSRLHMDRIFLVRAGTAAEAPEIPEGTEPEGDLTERKAETEDSNE